MKHLAAAGLLLMLAVLAIGAWSAMHQMPVPAAAVSHDRPTARVPDMTELAAETARTERLIAGLDAIAARAFAPGIGTTLIAHANTAHRAAGVAEPDAAGPSLAPRRIVSLLYLGQDFRRAVIDGKYVGAGDRLPDGTRVERITNTSVQLRGRHGRRVLHVPSARRVAAPPH